MFGGGEVLARVAVAGSVTMGIEAIGSDVTGNIASLKTNVFRCFVEVASCEEWREEGIRC